MDNNLVAWAAGFFDAKGLIYIGRCWGSNSINPSHCLHCDLTCTEVQPLESIKAAWSGGWLGRTQPTGSLAQERGFVSQYYLRLSAKKALKFLSDILPYLRTYKAFQARLAVQFQQNKRRPTGRLALGQRERWLLKMASR